MIEAILKTVSKILSTAFISVLVLLAILLVGVRLIGFTPYTVLSGSMEPTYHVGSVIYVSDVDPEDLKDGDPITFRMSSGVVATHRIVEVLDEGTPNLAFRTKGDANADPDGSPVPASAIIGKPRFSIPYLGYVSSFVQKPKGLILVLGTGATLFIMSTVIDSLFKDKKNGSFDTDDMSDEQDDGEDAN